MRRLAQTVVILAALVIGMLGWTIVGSPPHSFFALLKGVALISAIVSAYFVFRISQRLSLLSLALLIGGVIQVTGKMHRREWVPYDLGTIVLFAIVITVALASLVRSRTPGQFWNRTGQSLEKK